MDRVPAEVVRELTIVGYPDDAKEAVDVVERVVRSLGWEVDRELPVNDRGDGRAGRIDLCAWKRTGERFFVEVDRRRPRVKSMRKLRDRNGPAIVVLRAPAPGFPPVIEVDQGPF